MPRSVVPLVGRAAELARLLATLDAAFAPEGDDRRAAVALVGGDAGVGKSRLLREVGAAAVDRGALVLVGHCVDLGEKPPPYLPVGELFSRLAAERPELVDELVRSYPAIARLLPGRRTAAGDDRLDRAELFESVLGALVRLSDDAPVVLVVEDLHWADQATRDLLGFFFARLHSERLVILASYRSDDLHRRHPLRPSLAQWTRLPEVSRVELEPLPPADVRRLVRLLESAALSESDVTGIVTRADGNPFFAEELVAAALQCADAHALPWQLADLLLVRLDRLSDDAREVVRAAAVAGRRVDHAVLARVVELDPARLDDALRNAVDAHVLEPTADGRGYGFRHALLAEAVYDDLLPGERVRLHAAYAALLAGQPGRSSAELARHALASHDLQTAYLASVRAGDEAMSVAAPLEALHQYETALDLRAEYAGSRDVPVELVVSLVDASVAAGQATRGLRLATQTLAELPGDASDADRAWLLYAVARAAVDSESEADSMNAAGDALRLTAAQPSVFRVRASALYSRVNLIRGREVDAERWAREAIEVADALGMQPLAAEARTTLALLRHRSSEPAEVAAQLGEIAEQARAAGEPAAEVRSRFNLGSLLFEQGDLVAAEQAFDLAWRRSRELGRGWSMFGLEARAMVGLARHDLGDWDRALETLDTTGEAAPEDAEARLRATALLVQVGRGAVVAEAAESLRPWWRRDSSIANASAQAMMQAYVHAGAVDAAFTLIDEVTDLLGELWQEEWFLGRIRYSALGVMAASAAAANAPTTIRERLVARSAALVEDGRIAAEKGVPRGRRPGLEAIAWVARLEAEWARIRWLAGVEPPDEEDHLQAWQRTVDAFGYGNLVEATRSRLRLAQLLRAVGRPDDAADPVSRALAAARAMRAAPLLEELRPLTSSVSEQRAPSGLAALTEREREVLDLLVDARTNRQIAGRLYISEKTVSVHVSNILAKLGVRSRAEAAALARARTDR